MGKIYFYFYLLILFLLAGFNIFIGMSHRNDWEYLLIGLLLLFLSIGLVRRSNLAREVLLFVSKVFIFLIYIPLWLLLLAGKLKGFSGIAVLSLAPVFIVSLMSISCLSKVDIKCQFFIKEKKGVKCRKGDR